MTITLTPFLREKAGRAKKRWPSGAQLRHRGLRVDVAFRPWHDHYDFFNKAGNWIATVCDSSLPGQPAFDNISTAEGVRIKTPQLA